MVIVLLVLAWWLFTKPQGASMGNNATTTATTTSTVGSTTTGTGTTVTTGTTSATVTTSLKGESVQVDDQPAGSSVNIAKLTVTRSTWVAVRDARSVLGARRFEPGVTSGTIPLLRATTAGQNYTVVMYVDDGDKAFDVRKDLLVTNGTGAPVGDMFAAQ